MSKHWLEQMGDKIALRHQKSRSDGTYSESLEFLDYGLVKKFIIENLTVLILRACFKNGNKLILSKLLMLYNIITLS
jgi:hypothetical protein